MTPIAVWRSGSLENMALGGREALIDEAWPWLGGGELIVRGGQDV